MGVVSEARHAFSSRPSTGPRMPNARPGGNALRGEEVAEGWGPVPTFEAVSRQVVRHTPTQTDMLSFGFEEF